MNELILDLVDVIKESNEYKLFKSNDALLLNPETHALLLDYQSKINKYNELKKYNEYIDNDALKNEIKDLKLMLSKDQNVENYYNSYYQLNGLLDEVTQIVFNHIDESLIKSGINNESHCR